MAASAFPQTRTKVQPSYIATLDRQGFETVRRRAMRILTKTLDTGVLLNQGPIHSSGHCHQAGLRTYVEVVVEVILENAPADSRIRRVRGTATGRNADAPARAIAVSP